MQFGTAFPYLLALSAISALAYGLYFLRRPESLLRAVVKTGLMGGLALAFIGAPTPLVIALVAAAIGDFFLAFEKCPWGLPLGMLAFLIMQFVYIFCLFFLWFWAGETEPVWPRYALMALVVLAIGAYLIVFWRDPERAGNPVLATAAVLGALTLGAFPLVGAALGYATSFGAEPNWTTIDKLVFFAIMIAAVFFMWLRRDLVLVKLAGMIYAAFIAQMALMSFWIPWTGWMVMLGAILFLVSDGVLSWEMFRMKEDAPARRITAPVVWWTYAIAQWLIVLGMMFAANASFV
jgi:hypothetical protein